MAVDTSCRPHEILRMKIKDIVFKMAGDRQYAEVLVSGKTGNRVIPLFNSIPFLKEWIQDHPQGGNPCAILFCGLGNRMGRRLSRYAIYDIYESYKKKIFPSLLQDENVPKEDKDQMSKLLKKRFNPYILRHSALTQKASVLREHVLRQHAGWTMNSKMPQIYIHWFGNESSNTLLELYGINKDHKPSEKLKPKECPNCKEPNKIDSKFCSKCRMVLTYNEYVETLEKEKAKVNTYVEKLQGNLVDKSANESTKIEEPIFIIIDGKQAGTFVFTGKPEAQVDSPNFGTFKQQVWVIITKDFGYFISFLSSPTSFNSPENIQVRNQFIKSIKFLE